MRVNTVADRVMDSKHLPLSNSTIQSPGFNPQGSENVVSQVYNHPAGYQGKNQRPEPPPDFGFKIHGQIGRDYRSGSHHEKIPPFHINVFSKQNKPRYRKTGIKNARALIHRVM